MTSVFSILNVAENIQFFFFLIKFLWWETDSDVTAALNSNIVSQQIFITVHLGTKCSKTFLKHFASSMPGYHFSSENSPQNNEPYHTSQQCFCGILRKKIWQNFTFLNTFPFQVPYFKFRNKSIIVVMYITN